MRSIFVLLGALCALVGVAAGAFGAHALNATISPEALSIYHTGTDYQMWHALGLLAIGILHQQTPNSQLLRWAGWLMFGGIGLFSGSLYLLALTNLRWLGMITPIGGVGFLLAWLLLCCTFINKKNSSRYQ
jgi:uncharacterized membrane protein YgdD (TMEM256/DUF423 family)